MAIPTLKTVADAEKARKESPFMYLVSFIAADGKPGSLVMACKERQPLWRVYFIMNEMNKIEPLITIMNVVDLEK